MSDEIKPPSARQVFTFTSDGTHTPAGEYLITVWPSGDVELAWRPEPDRRIVWGPPIRGTRP